MKTIKKIVIAALVSVACGFAASAEGTVSSIGVSFPPLSTYNTIKEEGALRLLDGMGFDYHIRLLNDSFTGLNIGVQALYATPCAMDVSDEALSGKSGLAAKTQVGVAMRVLNNRIIDFTVAPGVGATAWLPLDGSGVKPIFRGDVNVDVSCGFKISDKTSIMVGNMWNWYLCDVVNGNVNWFDKFELGCTSRIGIGFYL